MEDQDQDQQEKFGDKIDLLLEEIRGRVEIANNQMNMVGVQGALLGVGLLFISRHMLRTNKHLKNIYEAISLLDAGVAMSIENSVDVKQIVDIVANQKGS